MNCNYDNYTINIITHDPGNTPEIISKLYPLEIKIFNGNNFPSFSKIVNETIVSSENDNVIIINYKARPNKKDIFKILDLLDKGYGFVGLYRFGFFGVNKNLIKKIGFFDERYIGGEYEDCDFIRRLLYHNIAFYISEEIEYIYRPSLWNNSISKKFFEKKWTHHDSEKKVYKNLDEEEYTYELNIKKHKDFFLDKTHFYNGVEKDLSFYENIIIKNF